VVAVQRCWLIRTDTNSGHPEQPERRNCRYPITGSATDSAKLRSYLIRAVLEPAQPGNRCRGSFRSYLG
jgi:hypothetical protein